jgi:DNA-binding HxlR family transcriptional regulator
VAKALDVVGERWTLLIVRDLILGPRRYVDLQKSLLGITTNLLAERLKRLQAEGFIETVALESPSIGHAYSLTDVGRQLEPVVFALGAFGARYLSAPAPGDSVDPRWAMVSLKRRYQGASQSGRVQLQLGSQCFGATFAGAQLVVRDGPLATPEATITGNMPSWFRLFTRQSSLRESIAAKQLIVTGHRRVAMVLVKALGLRS